MRLRLLTVFLTPMLLCLTGASACVHAALLDTGEQEIHVAPDSPANAKFRDGVAALMSAKLADAQAAFEAANRLDPKLAGPLIGLAAVAMEQDKPAEVEKWLTAADRAQPDSDAVDIAWGRYYKARKDYAKAEQAFREAARTRPSAVAFQELGDICLADEHRRQEALEAYAKAVELAPGKGALRFAYATALAAAGQVDKAMDEFQEAVRLAPADPDPWRAIGRLYAEKHRYDDAAAAFARGLGLAPKSIALLVDSGDVAAARGKLDEVRIDPANPGYLDTLGWAYRTVGDLGKAEASLARAATLPPPLADVHYHLGVVYAEMDRKPEAGHCAEARARDRSAVPAGPRGEGTIGRSRELTHEECQAEARVDTVIRVNPRGGLDRRVWRI